MENKEEKLFKMRHSLAHIMAAAVQRIYPDAKFGVGPAINDGFYYDIDLGDNKISENNFGKIEKAMRRIIAESQDFVRSEVSIEDAINWAKENNQPYKLELLNDLKNAGTTNAKILAEGDFELGDGAETVSFYTNGNYKDLCRGPHLSNTKEVGAFKLMRVAGAYWRGDEKIHKCNDFMAWLSKLKKNLTIIFEKWKKLKNAITASWVKSSICIQFHHL